MSFLLRRTRKSVWVGAARSRESAVQEFARTDQDTDGVSVFEATSEEDRLIIVAAIACERENFSRVDLIEVARDTLERYGPVSRTPENGTTPVPAANQLHCSLDWDPPTLSRMAEELFDAGVPPREFATPVVRDAVRSLDASAVIGKGAQLFVSAEQARSAKR
jgi:hypothetical protein